MKMGKIKNFGKKLVIFSYLLAALFLNIETAKAYDESQLESVESQLEVALAGSRDVIFCRERLVPLYDIETFKFFEFLDEHFKNESSTSTLLNTAIRRYRGYKAKLREYYNELNPSTAAQGAGVVRGEAASDQLLNDAAKYEECAELTQVYIDLAKEQMIRHIQRTGVKKNTTIYVQKYQALNARLRDLNVDIAKMLANYSTLNNKLPAFTQQCVQQ